MARFIKMCGDSAPDIRPAKLLKHRLFREMEPNVVAMHRMWMHVARFSIQIVQRNMQVIRSYLVRLSIRIHETLSLLLLD